MEKPSIVQADNQTKKSDTSFKRVENFLKRKIRNVFEKTNTSFIGVISGGYQIDNFNYLKKLKKKKSSKKKKLLKNIKIPIGILENSKSFWINALMQFIIFIPSLRRMFDSTPSYFDCFNEFIDLYIEDQREGRRVTRATTMRVFECLRKRFSKVENFKSSDIFYLLKTFKKMAFGDFEFDPFQQIEIKDGGRVFEEEVLKDLREHKRNNFLFPMEILISFKDFFEKSLSICKAPLRLFFYENKENISYRLSAFMEYRNDDFLKKGSYIAYLKADDRWYKCFNRNIKEVELKSVLVALRRGFIFYYRRRKEDFRKVNY
jgi:hypothetical protein